MSFIATENGRGFEAGYFLLADEKCVRVTKTISAEHAQAATLADGRKVVPAGAIWPSNDGEAQGIVYEDIDVTNGDAPGAVVVAGKVYADRLPAAAESAAVTAMADIAFVAASPEIVRPDFSGEE